MHLGLVLPAPYQYPPYLQEPKETPLILSRKHAIVSLPKYLDIIFLLFQHSLKLNVSEFLQPIEVKGFFVTPIVRLALEVVECWSNGILGIKLEKYFL